MKRIIFVHTDLTSGGVESLLFNIVKHLDPRQYQVDFLIYRTKKLDAEDEAKKLGCRVIKIQDARDTNVIKHFMQVYRILKIGNYDVVHCNTNFDSGLVMLAAWACKVPNRVTHSHTSESKAGNFKQAARRKVGKILIKAFATKCIACGESAGRALFEKKFFILRNGVDLKSFSFQEKKRAELRKFYHIPKDAPLIGHVGRFIGVKNHPFILEVFLSILKQNEDAHLLLVGDGPDLDIIQRSVFNNSKLKGRVIFTGNVQNVNELYNAMDILILPSIHEGFPFSAVEAQVNGLRVVASTGVPCEANLIGNISFLSLSQSPDEWASVIMTESKKGRHNNKKFFLNSDYNAQQTANRLLDIYNYK